MLGGVTQGEGGGGGGGQVPPPHPLVKISAHKIFQFVAGGLNGCPEEHLLMSTPLMLLQSLKLSPLFLMKITWTIGS